jgi:DNA invertase Pin-like site-specific DNA recombinase
VTRQAVIYCRISKDRTGAGLGVERQEQDARELATRLGATVVETYADNDASAYSGKPRKGYERMLADLDRPGAPQLILCWHTDRLHRQNKELESFIDFTTARGVTVHTVRAGPIDLSTASGQFQARVLGAAAQYESKLKSERGQRQKEQARDRGQWHGGAPPFGWQGGEEGLVLAPDEAVLIVTGTRMLLAGRSLGAVIQTFNAAEPKPRRGQTWSRRTVGRALGRWANAGLVSHRDQPVGPATWPALATPDGDVITAEDVKAVRAILADNAAERHRHGDLGNQTKWLLGGIAICVCGAPMRSSSTGVSAGRRRPVYRCTVGGRGHVTRSIAPLDAFIRELVARRLRLPDLADLLPASGLTGPQASELRAEVARLEERLQELAVLLGDEVLDPAGYQTAARRVRDRLTSAERELSAALRRSPLAPVLSARDPGAAFLAADIDVQRSVVRELITVRLRSPRLGRFDVESVAIEWRHDPGNGV